MSDQSRTGRDDLSNQIVDRAARDPAFREELLRNPKRTVEQELGVSIPASIEIRVVEEAPSTLYLVLPSQPIAAGQELSDQDLEQVAGGWSGAEGGQSCGCMGGPG